jgi:hypothetical protein
MGWGAAVQGQRHPAYRYIGSCGRKPEPQPDQQTYFFGSASCSIIQAHPLWGTGFLSAFFTI